MSNKKASFKFLFASLCVKHMYILINKKCIFIRILFSWTDSMFWTVKGSLVKGKPRALSHFGFPVWVQDVDAAVHIATTGRTLFFMHDIYWR